MACRPGAAHEVLCGGELQDIMRGQPPPQGGALQRADRDHLFADRLQGLAARGDQRQLGGAQEQLLQHGRRRRDHMLAVVDDQQRLPVFQEGLHAGRHIA